MGKRQWFIDFKNQYSKSLAIFKLSNFICLKRKQLFYTLACLYMFRVGFMVSEKLRKLFFTETSVKMVRNLFLPVSSTINYQKLVETFPNYISAIYLMIKNYCTVYKQMLCGEVCLFNDHFPDNSTSWSVQVYMRWRLSKDADEVESPSALQIQHRVVDLPHGLPPGHWLHPLRRWKRISLGREEYLPGKQWLHIVSLTMYFDTC